MTASVNRSQRALLQEAGRAVVMLALVALAACGGAEESDAPPVATDPESAPSRSVRFVDVTEELGLAVRHIPGVDEDYAMPAVMGGGFAVFDLEGDGDPDLYVVQSGEQMPYEGPRRAANVLLRNDGGRFADVSDGSGADDRGYGQGVAVGDVDSDGHVDLFVTNFGPDVLLRNRGDGTFEDVTAAAGVAGDGWSSSALFVDFDADGLLDLFVARYVEFDPDRVCLLQSGLRDFCGPAQFRGASDRLYRNLGDFRFEDVSRSSGVAARADRGLGVAAADFDEDGRLDLYVANDTDPNHLWINRGDGTFSEDGVLLGVAFNRFGVGEAGMGVAVGDADLDGDPDLFVSHLIEETNTLYENRGAAGFEDVTAQWGLSVDSVGYTGFGTMFADFDNDGDPDLAVANGAVKQRPDALIAPGRASWAIEKYVEPNQRFENLGAGRFRLAGADDFSASLAVHRGLTAVDLDGDGDLDLLVSQIEGPLLAFRNDGGKAGPALRLRVLEGRRTAFGATVEVSLGGKVRRLLVEPLGGYLTSGDQPLHFGLGESTSIDDIVVEWVGGGREAFAVDDIGGVVELRRGEGSPG
ncbi:MAG: CRTAC1 family protein [Acidobacteriota bacterium]